MNFSRESTGLENGDFYPRGNRKRNLFPNFLDFVSFGDEFLERFWGLRKRPISIPGEVENGAFSFGIMRSARTSKKRVFSFGNEFLRKFLVFEGPLLRGYFSFFRVFLPV